MINLYNILLINWMKVIILMRWQNLFETWRIIIF